jgi:glyoxylase-like metal-dependent hydrolase (beta-lactamase superfamily II)
LAPAGVIPFVREMAFEYGRVDQVSPLIRRIVARNPGPFTFTGTGTYVVGRGEVAVIDPGPQLEEHLQAILAALERERVTAIVTTHTHQDHSPLAGALAQATGARIIGRAAPFVEEGGVRLDEGHDAHFRPDEFAGDGLDVSGPGWTLRAMATPGHVSNHVCWALLQENALFSGDHVMGWSTTVVSPPDGDMGDYYASLDRVAEAGFERLWPTHGPPVTQVQPFLAAYKAHRLERERQILDQLAPGPRRIAEMVHVIYAEVDARLHPAAARSMLAHLIHLVRIGVVRCEGEPGPDSHYRLA